MPPEAEGPAEGVEGRDVETAGGTRPLEDAERSSEKLPEVRLAYEDLLSLELEGAPAAAASLALLNEPLSETVDLADILERMERELLTEVCVSLLENEG